VEGEGRLPKKVWMPGLPPERICQTGLAGEGLRSRRPERHLPEPVPAPDVPAGAYQRGYVPMIAR
jgi:hypothetical protein